jgi:hypothetical protein
MRFSLVRGLPFTKTFLSCLIRKGVKYGKEKFNQIDLKKEKDHIQKKG